MKSNFFALNFWAFFGQVKCVFLEGAGRKEGDGCVYWEINHQGKSMKQKREEEEGSTKKSHNVINCLLVANIIKMSRDLLLNVFSSISHDFACERNKSSLLFWLRLYFLLGRLIFPL